jgi:hypothetical protein
MTVQLGVCEMQNVGRRGAGISRVLVCFHRYESAGVEKRGILPRGETNGNRGEGVYGALYAMRAATSHSTQC